MTWSNRFRLFVGLVVVVLTVGALTIAFSQRKGQITSTSASIEAVTFPVGSDFPGAVVDEKVVEGDAVSVGDPIATIQSNALLQKLSDHQTIASSDVYTVHKDGTLTIKSTVDGVVGKVIVQQGGYAAAGAPIAVIYASSPLSVQAEFLLDPKDFARLQKGAAVSLELPNSDVIDGEVDSFDVSTVDGHAKVDVKVTSKSLVFGKQSGLVVPGTPVIATMTLKNDDVLARAVGSVRSFVRDVLSAFAE